MTAETTRTTMTERLPLPRKVPTQVDHAPIAGCCPEKSARGRYCYLSVGHLPPHRGVNRHTWVTVLRFEPSRPLR